MKLIRSIKSLTPIYTVLTETADHYVSGEICNAFNNEQSAALNSWKRKDAYEVCGELNAPAPEPVVTAS